MADWQKIREGYDRSSIDWQRLNAYARRLPRPGHEPTRRPHG